MHIIKMIKRYIATGAAILMATFSIHAQKISFEKNVVDAGSTLWKRPVTATFRFTNKERTPLRIKEVDAGCGCLSTDWTKTAIAKGGKGEIRITYDAALMGHMDRYIDVYTNGSEKPERIRMKAWVGNGQKQSIEEMFPYNIDDIRLSTNEVVFPDVQSGDSAKAEIEVMNTSKDVYTPQLMHLPPYITAEYKPEMIARGRRGKIVLTLHSDKLQDLGLNQTNIYLARFSGDKVGNNNDISMSAILLPDLQYAESFAKQPAFAISTSELYLGKLGKKKKLTGTVILSNKGRGVLKLSKIQAFNQAITIALSKTELQPDEEVKMKVTVDARFLGLSKAHPRVLIITNDPKTPKSVVNVKFEK